MKEYKNLSVIFCLIAAVSGFVYFTQKPEKPKNEQLYNTKNLTSEQKEAFSDSVKTGDAYVYYGDHKKAVEEFKQAEQLNPKDRQTLYRLASSQHNAGQYEDAEKTLEKLEKSEADVAEYWSFRASNISKKPDSFKNINLAVKYVEKAYDLSKYKEAPLFLETRARVYLEQYKYYRIKRQAGDSASSREKNAKENFLNSLNELKAAAEKNNDTFFISIHDDLYNQYVSFPVVKYKSAFKERPELDKIEYTQADIERIKKHRPQDSFTKDSKSSRE